MPDVTIKVDGLAALHLALSELPERVAKNSLRRAVNAGAGVIRDEARAKAPTWTGPVSQGHPPAGTLQRSIIVKQIPEQSSYYRQVYYVTVRHGKKYQRQGRKGNLSQDAFYWSWVEFGHWVNTTGKALGGSNKDRNRARAIAAGHTTFIPAHPFMRPAFDTKKQAAIDAIRDKLAEGIEQARQELKR